MLLPRDKKMFDDVCCDYFETQIDDASRLRFSTKIVGLLKQRNVVSLLRFPDITGEGVILCPPENREIYQQAIKPYLPENDDDGYFKYFVTKAAKFDNRGRIMLTKACMLHAGISINDPVVIFDVGPWFGVWKFDKWKKLMQSKTVA